MLDYDRKRSPEYYECLVVILFCGYRGVQEFLNASRLHPTSLYTNMQMCPYRKNKPLRRKETTIRFLECLHSGYQENKHNLQPYQRDFVKGWINRWKGWILTCLESHKSTPMNQRVPRVGQAKYYVNESASRRARKLREFQMDLDAFVFDTP